MWFAEHVPKTETESHTLTSQDLKEAQLPLSGETVALR